MQVDAATDANSTALQAEGPIKRDGAGKLQQRENIELIIGNKGTRFLQMEEERGEQCIIWEPPAV